MAQRGGVEVKMVLNPLVRLGQWRVVTKTARINLFPFILVPGQPVDFSWEFKWVSKQQQKAPSIDVKVLWNNHLLWETTVPALSFKAPGYAASGTGHIDNMDPSVSKVFYHPGTRQIDLEILWTGHDWDGATSGKISFADWLDVILDDPVDNWWQWTSPTKITADWNTPYSLEGTVTNKHKFANAQFVTASLWEWEVGNQGGKQQVASKFPDPASLAVSASVPMDFGEYKQDWEWLVKHAWVIKGDLVKQFVYQVRLDVVDEFGNPYSADVPQTTTVNVGVSALKRELAAAAFSAAVLAADLLVAAAAAAAGILTAWAAPGLLAAAGAAAATAEFTGNEALDPPEPDPEFKSRVVRPEIPLDPEDPAFGKGLPTTRRFLKLALEVGVLNIMRSRIFGKILGARRAGQPTDERRQRDSHLTVLGELREKIQTLREIADDADAEVADLLRQAKEAFDRQDIDLPDQVPLAELKGAEKLPPELLNGLINLLALPELEELNRNTGRSLAHIAEALSHAMNAREEEDSRLLA